MADIDPLPEEFLPSVSDVAALLWARTRDNQNNEKGTFDTTTRPTAVEVTSLINTAAFDVVAEVGFGLVDANQIATTNRVVALRAAMLVELSYFPEQINSDQSPYQQLAEMYALLVATLKSLVMDNQAGGTRVYTAAVTSPTLAAQNGLYNRLADEDEQ